MLDKMKTLKDIDYKKCSFWTAIVADVLYILNIIVCVIKYFRLDVSVPEDQFQKEQGLLQYITDYCNDQVLLIIGWSILVLATIFLFVSYILENKGVFRFVLMICFIALIVIITTLFLLDLFSRHYIKAIPLIDIVSMSLGLFLLLLLFVSFVLFVVNGDYRKKALVLLGSLIWMSFGIYIMALVVALLIGHVIVWIASFFTERDEGNTVIEIDRSGHLVHIWKK